MAFMRKDVNLALLLLIVVSILLFAGFSVYYQTTFKDVSLEYQTKLEQLGQVTKQLGEKRAELNETYALRVKAEEDRKVLDERYQDVSDENSKFRVDIANLQVDLSSTKNELTATKNLLSQVQAELSSAKSDISRLKRDLKEVCDDYTTLNGGVEHDEC